MEKRGRERAEKKELGRQIDEQAGRELLHGDLQ